MVNSRLEYLENGLWQRDPKRMLWKYIRSLHFKLDVLSLVPSDVLYFWIDHYSLLRTNRLLKFRALLLLFEQWDTISQKLAIVIRLSRTLTLMLMLNHIYACVFYRISIRYEDRLVVFSKWKNLSAIYQGTTYGYCFFYCFKVVTCIGDNPEPTRLSEYIFLTVGYVSAMFIFAVMMGQVRDVFQALSSLETKYRFVVDRCLSCATNLDLNIGARKRIREWFDYNWEQRRTLDENDFLCILPPTLKTELAISVHFDTLSKVLLFKNCERALLYALVLKLKNVLFLPGDYICKKGDVGSEMFIIASGFLDVYVLDNEIAVTLKAGNVFGEISLLTAGGRRTADVKSRGYSRLFALSKSDFKEVMDSFPDALRLLKRKVDKTTKMDAQKRANEQRSLYRPIEGRGSDGRFTNWLHQSLAMPEMLQRSNKQPRLIETVFQAVEASRLAFKHRFKEIGRAIGLVAPEGDRQSTNKSQVITTTERTTVNVRCWTALDTAIERSSLSTEDNGGLNDHFECMSENEDVTGESINTFVAFLTDSYYSCEADFDSENDEKLARP
ncbi:hypothetical protein ACOME3_001805 [Neoechinorhynchus agilis]